MRRTSVKTGLTTGACAAAAAKGAALALFADRFPPRVEIRLPTGETREVELHSLVRKGKATCCKVRKEKVERGDVTGGLTIAAVVRHHPRQEVLIKGGRGVGRVTKPGLAIPRGERAINPVPRKMILESVREVLEHHRPGAGCVVVISVPGGEIAARHTLNSRLGIQGGISILGTTGLVIPYSDAAFRASLRSFLEVSRSCGSRRIAIAGGRRSERCARERLGWSDEEYVLVGDHFDEALRLCVELDFEMASVWAMPAKMFKIAAGYLNTRWTTGCESVTVLEGFLERVLPHQAGLTRRSPIKSVFSILGLLEPAERREVLEAACHAAALNCHGATGGRLRVQCHVVGERGELLAWSAVVG